MIPYVCSLWERPRGGDGTVLYGESTAKSVKTDLALVLLRRRADKTRSVPGAPGKEPEWQGRRTGNC